LCTWIISLVKLSGYCSPIEDHVRLLEYSSALPSIYRFAICSTLPVFLTMSINNSLHMDPHVSFAPLQISSGSVNVLLSCRSCNSCVIRTRFSTHHRFRLINLLHRISSLYFHQVIPTKLYQFK